VSVDEKLIEKIRARPAEADFGDVRRLLESFGWSERPGKGSHTVFKKPGYRSITIPTVSGRKVKRVYLDQICRILELDD
jgi:predicted RNA binding protein YcfA (HicA-like mRNA interferase family)